MRARYNLPLPLVAKGCLNALAFLIAPSSAYATWPVAGRRSRHETCPILGSLTFFQSCPYCCPTPRTDGRRLPHHSGHYDQRTCVSPQRLGGAPVRHHVDLCARSTDALFAVRAADDARWRALCGRRCPTGGRRPRAYRFLLDFAKDNELTVIDPSLPLSGDVCALPGNELTKLVRQA